MQKITLFILLLSTLSTKAQNGRLSGTIVDSKTGETLLGATIFIEGTSKGAAADFDGKFNINQVPPGKVNVVVSYVSYTTKKIEGVIIKANETTDINIILDQSSAQDLQEVEVVVTLNKENNTALVLQQKNNASVSDGISAETIKRSPDRNTSDVLKRISGVTIQDDKFVIIRGLNERYNASYLNNSPLPSTEPDKKAFAFDLFPANMLDNIVINKTATPDMPSEFAGGIVQVNTKSIPEKNFVSFSVGGGYNSLTTGKTKTFYEGGKFDRFGFDDGSRNLPAQVPALEDKETWIKSNDQARVATYFANDWATTQSKYKPNTNMQFATGYNFKRKEKDFFGLIFSLGYNNTNNLFHLQRQEYDGITIEKFDRSNVQNEQRYFNTINQTQTSTGALLNFSCKPNENHSISLKNLLTAYSDNKFIYATGTNPIGTAGQTNRIDARFFTANRIYSSQLNSEHYFPNLKIKMMFNAGLSRIQRTVPNLRFMVYTRKDEMDPSNPNPLDTSYSANIGSTTGPDFAGYRVYSKLDEQMKNSKVDASRLFKLNEKSKLELKAGVFFQYRERQFNIRQFGMDFYNGPGISKNFDLAYLSEDKIFAPENMSVTSGGLGGFKAIEITKPDDNYHATSKLFGSYVMGEIKHTEKLRVITGMRFENYTQKLNIQYNKIDSTFVNSTVKDLLPSLNVIYNINTFWGIRAAYYKTLNRPEFRELAVTSWFDPETRLSIAGNDTLKRSYIQNCDFRLEAYPGRGQLITITGFYKYFSSPIERYLKGGQENQIVYRNANFGQIIGTEFEYRINLGAILKKDSVPFLNNLNIFSNLSLIKSEVNVKGINDKLPDTRVMQGQAPYIINGGISYVDQKNAFSITAMLNRVGQKINLVGNNLILDRWDNAYTVVDLQVTKSFFKNKLEIRFNIKDLFHPDRIIYYKGDQRKSNAYNPNIDYVNFKRNYGSTYSLIVSYKF